MDSEPIQIRIDEKKTVAGRAPHHRSDALPWVLAGVAGLLVVALVVVLLPEDKVAQEQPRVEPRHEEPRALTADSKIDEVANQDVPIVDDGKTLWESPTTGTPLDLSYTPAGTQLVFYIRVADLLAHPEHENVLAALGPWGEQALRQLTNLTGAEPHEIETALVGIYPTRAGPLETIIRLQLLEPWQETREISARGIATFLPEEAGGKILVACPESVAAELKTSGDQPPLFPREMQRVLQRTDASRMVTLALPVKFLQISGDKFLTGPGKVLREAILDFLGEDAGAIVLSAHWSTNFFLELQSTVNLKQPPHRFAAALEKRLANASNDVENTLLAEPVPPYGRKVLARFPAMLRKMSAYTRSGVEADLSVQRCYLPVTAGHNLLLASELFLNGPTGESVPLAAIPPRTITPRTMDERLQKSTSLVFPKETLQKALEMLSEDLGIPIEIAGRDLQLEGITKNQSFALDLRNRPAAEILLAVLLRANPDRTASGPDDSKQKLVYVMREATVEQPASIVVTTRAAAKKRGETLPAVFDAQRATSTP